VSRAMSELVGLRQHPCCPCSFSYDVASVGTSEPRMTSTLLTRLTRYVRRLSPEAVRLPFHVSQQQLASSRFSLLRPIN